MHVLHKERSLEREALAPTWTDLMQTLGIKPNAFRLGVEHLNQYTILMDSENSKDVASLLSR